MENQQSKIISTQTLIAKAQSDANSIVGHQFKLKWLAIGHGVHKQQSYQYVYRPFVKQSIQPTVKKGTDGIQIIPIIQYSDHKEIVFIANFRPAVGKFVIQFPAGLSEGQDMFQNAKRELEQQTGLVPYKFVQMPSPVIYSDPHKGNQSGIFFIALIDGSKEESFVPFKRQHTQNIRCYSMKYEKQAGICSKLQTFSKQHDYIMQAKTWLVCMTVDLVERLKDFSIKI